MRKSVLLSSLCLGVALLFLSLFLTPQVSAVTYVNGSDGTNNSNIVSPSSSTPFETIKDSIASPLEVVGSTYGSLIGRTLNVYHEGGASLWTAFLDLFRSNDNESSSNQTPPSQNVTIINGPSVPPPPTTTSIIVPPPVTPPPTLTYSGLSETRVREIVNSLNNELRQELFALYSTPTPTGTTTVIYTTNNYVTNEGDANESSFPHHSSDDSRRIDNLEEGNFDNDIDVGGNAHIAGDLTVDGSATFNGTTTFGNVAFTGGTVTNLNVTGNTALTNLTFTNATGTNATVTNLTATNLTGTSGAFTTLTQNGNAVCDTSGNCGSGVSTTSLATTFFRQGGNAFGTTATLGTTDNNQLNFITNNTTKLTILQNGNVGIGITNPGAPLDVNGQVRLGGPSAISAYDSLLVGVRPANDGYSSIRLAPVSNAGRGFKLDTFDNGTTQFFQIFDQLAGATRLLVDQNGNVGIASSTPSQKLSVTGNGFFTGSVTANSFTQNGNAVCDASGNCGSGISTSSLATTFFRQGGNAFGAAAVLGTTDGNPLNFITNNTQKAALTVTGNFGLGTANPTNRLDVAGGVAIGITYAGNATAVPVNSVAIEGQLGVGTLAPKNKFDVSGGAVIGTDYAATNVAPTNGLLVEGNVGIGTTTPSYLLTVAGTSDFTNSLNFNGNPGASGNILRSNGAGSAPSWVATSTLGFGTGTVNSGTAGYFAYYPSTGTAVSGQTALYTDNFGEIGIGTNAPEDTLDVNGGSIIARDTGFGAFSTIYNSDESKDLTLALGGLSLYSGNTGSSFYGDNTSLGIFTSGNDYLSLGTNNNEYMRITAGGNVGIRAAGPLSALDVGGGIAVGSYAGTSAAPTNGLIVSGNVGIGTNSPGYPLNFASALGDKISLYGASGNHYGFGIQGGLLQIYSDTSGSDIGFGYGSSGSFTQNVVFKGNGNVGIGTSTPNFKLTVAGTSNFTNALNFNGNAGLSGYILKSNGSGAAPSWVATSTLFAAGGSGTVEAGTEGNFAYYAASGNTVYDSGGVLFTDGSNIGVDNQSPEATLHVTDNHGLNRGQNTFYVTDDYDNPLFTVNNNGELFAQQMANGFATFDTVAPVCFDENTGEIGYIDGNTDCSVSSQRFKKNIEDSDAGLDELMKFRPVSFQYDNGSTNNNNHLGFIAEEVQKIDPRLIFYDKDGKVEGVRYDEITSLLGKSIQDLNNKVDDSNASTTASLSLLDHRLSFLEGVSKKNPSSDTSGTSIWTTVQSFGSHLVDGLAYLKNVFVDNLTVGSKNHPTGITVYDKEGKAGCLTVDDVDSGKTKVTPGACDIQDINQPVITSTSTPIEDPTDEPTSTSTEPIVTPSGDASSTSIGGSGGDNTGDEPDDETGNGPETEPTVKPVDKPTDQPTVLPSDNSKGDDASTETDNSSASSNSDSNSNSNSASSSN